MLTNRFERSCNDFGVRVPHLRRETRNTCIEDEDGQLEVTFSNVRRCQTARRRDPRNAVFPLLKVKQKAVLKREAVAVVCGRARMKSWGRLKAVSSLANGALI